MPAQDDLAPLAAVLDQIQARLSAIEGKVGIDGPPPPAVAVAAPGALTLIGVVNFRPWRSFVDTPNLFDCFMFVA